MQNVDPREMQPRGVRAKGDESACQSHQQQAEVWADPAGTVQSLGSMSVCCPAVLLEASNRQRLCREQPEEAQDPRSQRTYLDVRKVGAKVEEVLPGTFHLHLQKVVLGFLQSEHSPASSNPLAPPCSPVSCVGSTVCGEHCVWRTTVLGAVCVGNHCVGSCV